MVDIVLSSLLPAGATNAQTTENVPQASIHLEQITDKESQQPIENNTITLRWETPDGEIINTEQYINQESLSKVMLADGRMKLFTKVEAPGYIPWENAMRMYWAEDKPVYISAEME